MPANYGPLQPLRRDAKGDWTAGSGATVTQNEIEEALGIHKGELAWDTNRGSNLHLLRHQARPLSVLRDLAEVYVRDCLAEEVPTARVRQVAVTQSKGEDGQYTCLDITISYDVIDLNSGNLISRGQTATVTI